MRLGSSWRRLSDGLATVGLSTNGRALSSPWMRRPLVASKVNYVCRMRPLLKGDMAAEGGWERPRAAKLKESASCVVRSIHGLRHYLDRVFFVYTDQERL